MPDLAAQERAFAAALTARPVESADVSPLAGPAALARDRLRLYRGNVQANARKALAGAHPVCALIVGDEFFDGLAYAYAARTPSRSGDLAEYGDMFAEFLASFAPVVEQVPYLPDIAGLEWRVHVAHYAADARALDAGALAGLDGDRLAQVRLTPGPATALVESRWPVASLWRAHQPDGDLDTVDPGSGAERALVFRPHYRVDVRAVDAGEHAFLAAVLAAETFETALRNACAADPSFALERVLARCVADRVIVGARAGPG